jgi:hypothetical protein
MKTNKGLLEKRIDLSNCQINGGRLMEETQKVSSCSTSSGGCSDTTYTTTTDKDKWLSTCSDVSCP